MSRRLWLVCLVGIALGCGGSGRPSLVKVTGVVTLNGTPLEGAIVAFQPVTKPDAKFQRPSSAVTDLSGQFVLGTYATDDGVPIGKYKVGIQKREVVGGLPENYNSENEHNTDLTFKWITPRAVAVPETSNLQAEVTSSGLTPAKFDLQAPDQPEFESTGPRARATGP